MNYIKNSHSSYVGLQLFLFNLSYLGLLILLFSQITFIENLKKIIIIFFVISFILAFHLKKYNAELNIPNSLTSARLTINIFILAIVFNIEGYNEYLLINLILISLLLDGADGFFSRYLMQGTAFGSLFDQEVDNFLILILTISLVYNYDFIFIILIIPIYRYIFILLIRLKIISNQSLPTSFFRKLICVMTILSLALCNIYSTVDSIRILLYLVFILISYSFVKDTFYLYRRKYD